MFVMSLVQRSLR